MKAMIFAAGLGTRLRPLTDSCPKALIEVGGKTMLERVIERLRKAGVDKMVVNVHHHAGMIEDYLRRNKNFGVDIAVSDERDRLLDTGGGIVKAATLLTDGTDEPIMLYNADILTDFSLPAMLAAHERSGAEATLLVSATRKSSRGLIFDPDGRMCGWINHATGEIRSPGAIPAGARSMAFSGIHIINPSLIAAMASYGETHGDVFSLTPFYTDTCASEEYRAYLQPDTGVWIDIGRPETLAEARRLFADHAYSDL